ncbi:MAG TPA: DUF1501 domain-containing protein, partial [Urbifossiella sp.]|nr:DUF1501 domain-containing protein [Urbifossiella sp.]
QGKGRDHYAVAWSTVLAGGGVKGGQAIGRTSKDGAAVEDRPTTAGDLMATVCNVLRIDPEKTNMSNVGRPIPLADRTAKAVAEAVA